MNKKLSLIILFICLCVSFSRGQEKSSELKAKTISIKMDKQPLGEVFEYLMVYYDISIGFEESVLDREHNDYEFETNLPYEREKRLVSTDGKIQISITNKRIFKIKEHYITVNAENKSLQDVLDVIVGQMQNYAWEVDDGVVNIYPLKGRDAKFEQILKLNIRNFSIEGFQSRENVPIFLIRNQIFKLPELISFLDENKFYYNKLMRQNLDNLDRKIPNELNFSNLKFKDLLNKITKIKRGGWIMKKSDIYNTKEQDSVDLDI